MDLNNWTTGVTARPGSSFLFGAADLPSEDERDQDDGHQDGGAGEERPGDPDRGESETGPCGPKDAAETIR